MPQDDNICLVCAEREAAYERTLGIAPAFIGPLVNASWLQAAINQRWTAQEAYEVYVGAYKEGYGDGLFDEHGGCCTSEPVTFDVWLAAEEEPPPAQPLLRHISYGAYVRGGVPDQRMPRELATLEVSVSSDSKHVSAKLVAAGVGLPDSFVTVGGELWHTTKDMLYDFPDLPPVRIDYQTRSGLLRQLAMWAGDDGEAQAYWLHWCEDEGIWSLRDNRNSTSIIVEFDTLERAGCDRIDFLGLSSNHPPLHEATWLESANGHDEALAVIIEHIGRDHLGHS